MIRTAAAAACLLACAGAVSGQVVINEVYPNPGGPASTADVIYEYIELYGEPGMDLTGYAIGQVIGGTDPEGDDIPNNAVEIDEAFTLDGLTIGPDGFLVIFNDDAGASAIEQLLPAGANGAGFNDTFIPSPPEDAGNLENDGSATFLLVRRRPNHDIVGGVSVYEPGYAFRKDVNQDVDFDGKLDFGIESGGAAQLDPLQIIDEIAWSNEGGKEYVRDSEQEISETVGFNPDFASRIEYYNENPMLGLRTNGSGMTVPTRTADEEFIYGDMIALAPSLEVDPTRAGGPTDPNGDGFQDVDVAGFELTPGAFNDSAAAGVTQFRFVRGDFDFDGEVTADDESIIAVSLGRNLDEQSDCLDEFGMPIIDPSTMQPFQCWVEGREANRILAMMNMDKTDGMGGGNAPEVTQADIDAFNAEFTFCIADVTIDGTCDPSSSDGAATLSDFSCYLSLWSNSDALADITTTGTCVPGAGGDGVDLSDFSCYLAEWSQGCP
ncbi:MAG: GC-type dockerin domain-anchored protein [Planctomycetota bacterium]